MTDPFRRRCRALRLATLVVLTGLLVLTLSGSVGLPLWGAQGASPIEGEQRRWLHLIQALPAIGYLWALWSAQAALGALAAGRTFHPVVARALRNIGIGVLIGALLQVFAVVNLLRVVFDGRGSYLYFDLSAIVLGVIGAALILVSRLVDRARALQSELDEIV